jgi:predicted permease
MTWFHAARSRLRFFTPGAAESRIDDEFRFHLEMETQRLIREQQLDPDEARRRARAAFGGPQQHRETLREGRGTAWLGGLSLDLKLGCRMLGKYPGLTIVGGIAMAFGIWFGAVVFEMFGMLTTTKLPFPGGDRVVRIQNMDLMKGAGPENRVLYDYQLWRSARSITDLGAYRDASVNLVGADGNAEPVVGAEVTASAFRVIPTPPLLGRALQASDERAGAAPVVLLGHELWTKRFASDPRIVGRNVQLGSGFATVVGVMPEKFGFPIAHELWLPLRTDVAGVQPRRGLPINVFGRLASGMTLEGARAELAALNQRLAAEHPTTHAKIKTFVGPYTQMGPGDDTLVMSTMINFFVIALMVIVCGTVALLLFARSASRETELIVRSALGASRRRIVMQLFAEALVLAGVAAVVGLALAQLALTRLGKPYFEAGMGGLIPFWYDFNLSPTTIAYALVLGLIGAAVAGVMPARKITRGLGAGLRAGTAGGGVSFGGVWTAVIATQVALTVAFPLAMKVVRAESDQISSYDFGFPSQQYLGVQLAIDGPPTETLTAEGAAAMRTRFSTSLEALRRRLEVHPGIAGVTVVEHLPGNEHAPRRAQVVSLPELPPRWVATTSIHPSYFATLQAPMIAGRAFTNADLSADARVVIVDKAFADLVMPGRNAVGHRVRLSSGQAADSNTAGLPWYEIVGVVKELGMSSPIGKGRPPGLYLPLVPVSHTALRMIVHAQGDPLTLIPRIRQLATAADPALRIEEIARLDEVTTDVLWFLRLWERIISGLTGVALLLSLSGIYAVLSYIVARRTREIGVRVALGASARRVIMSIFRRPLIQVSIGVMAGVIIIAVAAIAMQSTGEISAFPAGSLTVLNLALLVGYAALMFGVCTLACVVPTVRALRVQPTEALRAE